MTGLTPAQLAERRQGITATDVPAILGLHPYRSAIDVWLEKMGEAPPREENERMRWGLLLEGPIRADYAQRRGARIWVPGTLTHATAKHRKATPDGLVFVTGAEPYVLHATMSSTAVAAGADRGLEIKTHRTGGWHAQYGEPGTDEVPDHELVQCAWGMHVTGLPRWDLVPFIDGLPTDYTITRNLELEAMLVDAADRFWVDHVLTKKPPAPDGSRQYTEWLRHRWPGRGPAVQADEPTAAAIARLRDVRTLQRQLGRQRVELEQTIQAAMGDAEAIEADGERLTWKRCKDSEHVDWEAVAKEFRNNIAMLRDARTAGRPAEEICEVLETICLGDPINRNTKTTPGARQFRVPPAWHTENE